VTLKKISNQVCPSLPFIYAAVKNVSNVRNLTASRIADFDGLIGKLIIYFIKLSIF
jgi:hypothetical protein